MRTYYIYKAVNKVNKKLYIGETCDFRARVWQHLRCYEKEDCLFHQEIKKYGIDNFEFEIIETTETEERAIELEKKYIKEWKTYSPYGYNMNMGGVGGHNARAVVCLNLDGEFVKRYRGAGEAGKDGYNNVNVLLCCKGKLLTCKNHMFMFEDEYMKSGAKRYIKPENARKKKIIQCDDKGNFIEKFDSVCKASEETGISRSTISGVLIGKYKRAGGFIFVYEEGFPIKDIKKYKHSKKGKCIIQIDKDTGKTINTFERISDAGKALGVNYKAIHKVVDKPGRTAYGYKWISK